MCADIRASTLIKQAYLRQTELLRQAEREQLAKNATRSRDDSRRRIDYTGAVMALAFRLGRVTFCARPIAAVAAALCLPAQCPDE
jgi:hypothetical protein